MAKRLNQISSQFVSQPTQYMHHTSFIPKEQKHIIQQVQSWANEYLTTPELINCVEQAKFPQFLLDPLKKLDIIQYFVGKPYGKPLSLISQGMILATLASYDASVATFVMLQGPLCGKTIQKLCTEEQKQRYMPDLVRLNKIWGWALTQQKVGSNATQIQTNVKENKNGYMLNGNKKWIGNGNKDFLIVYAKNLSNNKVNGFVVDMKIPGIKSQKIQYKLALRMVENCKITFNNVQLNKDSFIPDAKSYRKGVQSMLKLSRLQVAFIAAGICIGIYKNTIKYVTERKQFDVPLVSFQLIQLKVYEIMANLQSILLMCQRAAELASNGQITVGHISMIKAYVTERGRYISKLGRQAIGGNGITHDRYLMKALVDLQGIYTYEGTYDINALVTARELTGVSAFKK